MVSPYLLRPIRTLKQARKDRARGRGRSKIAVSTFSIDSMVHVLSSLVRVQTATGRGRPQSPTDRKAA